MRKVPLYQKNFIEKVFLVDFEDILVFTKFDVQGIKAMSIPMILIDKSEYL